jgi:predicted nucleic acid-binding protein
MILIDSNILARHLLQDLPDHSARSTRLFQRAVEGEVELFIPATVVAEISWLLIRQRGVPRHDVADALTALFQVGGIVVENAQAVASALRFLKSSSGLSFVDCYHLALAEELGMRQIYSFDKRMSRYPGVDRIEPEPMPEDNA